MNGFFPNTLDEWMGLLLATIGITTAAYGLIYRLSIKPLADDMARHQVAQGARIGALESSVSANAARTENLDRQSERLHLQVSTIFEQYGRMETRLQGIDSTLYRFHEERLAEDRRAGERLVAIETKMDIFSELNTTLKHLSQKIP